MQNRDEGEKTLDSIALYRDHSVKNGAGSTFEKMPQEHFLPKVCLL